MNPGLPAIPGLPANPGDTGPGLHPPGLNAPASVGAGEKAAVGVMPVGGVQGSIYGVAPPSGIHGVMGGD